MCLYWRFFFFNCTWPRLFDEKTGKESKISDLTVFFSFFPYFPSFLFTHSRGPKVCNFVLLPWFPSFCVGSSSSFIVCVVLVLWRLSCLSVRAWRRALSLSNRSLFHTLSLIFDANPFVKKTTKISFFFISSSLSLFSIFLSKMSIHMNGGSWKKHKTWMMIDQHHLLFISPTAIDNENN